MLDAELHTNHIIVSAKDNKNCSTMILLWMLKIVKVQNEVNKDFAFKAKDFDFKAKDFAFKAKVYGFKAKDFGFKTKDLNFKDQGLETWNMPIYI